MREDKVLRKPKLGALQLGLSGNEPVDEPDDMAPDVALFAPADFCHCGT